MGDEKMEITIALRGGLKRFFDGESQRIVYVPSDCTCAQALQAVSMDWEKIPNFGFVAVNGKRVMIYEKLSPGDTLKAYSAIGGG
jgi:hypothetical protein